ncbi:MAG: tRNA uridine-5-carboxymethylaminomethyl(34) synthesis GTPase MnmE [Candidatus Midichloria mitochondrii]|nr:tRNA uridine-5-carboxymethylaminomethyl(34) synthesis GTPase MnmE [Candidatus Midichloria mitochondrii]
MHDTIFALSTVLGKSGVAVIRISGPQARAVAKLIGYEKELEHKRATLATIYTLNREQVLDEVILLFFASPHSFNGEDILEIHLHGSIAIINDVLAELSKVTFLRIAEPGEFTKIAFYNGKMDLVKAEGLADFLDAETSMQKIIAQKQLRGELSDTYNKWRTDLIGVLSQLEALIDFPEDDIPEEVLDWAAKTVQSLIEEINLHLRGHDQGVSIMNGINIVISGAPNVGKSSLMNLLAKKEIAIVSDIAGTTRDVIQVKLDLGGFAVLLSDTAGIREANDLIEKEGIRRAKQAIKEADINIIVLNSVADFISHLDNFSDAEVIWMINKVDLMSRQDIASSINLLTEKLAEFNREDEVGAISTVSGYGIDNFLNLLQNKIKNKYQEAVLSPVTTRIRQKKGLEQCLTHLQQFNINKKLEIASQDVRIASEYIGMLTGKIGVEEILDEIFSNFCIGK